MLITNLPILGIDIAKETFQVVLLRGEKKRHKQFPNNEAGFAALSSWLCQPEAVAVWACLEATGIYHEKLAHFLHGAGHQVSVVNPARIKGYATSQLQRTKNDRADAGLVASYCQSQRPALWSPPPAVVPASDYRRSHEKAVAIGLRCLEDRQTV
jgi:transposase